MALSKSRRMQILLTINGLFFVIELVVGIWVHSLALVADSFHMLNDVLSLCVGIWAVNVAKSRSRSKVYTYGWQRAETLGALINGVFLVALCFSIILEAIQRFFDLPEVSNPEWILGVGSAGLAMNILGLFLFHDHGHGHSHREENANVKKRRANPQRASEEGEAPNRLVDSDTIADESGNIEDVLPENRIRAMKVNRTRLGESDDTLAAQGQSTLSSSLSRLSSSSRHGHRRRRSRTYSTLSEIPIHPGSIRNDIIKAGRMEEASEPTTDAEDDVVAESNDAAGTTEQHPLLTASSASAATLGRNSCGHSDHRHENPCGRKAHGRSHGDLNMRGVFLHVFGDALGNIGVIGTALFIWLTPYPWRFYADPVISLVITVIILCSALPLCRAASRILLQAVPTGLNVDDIKADILSLNGIIGCHHLHVWQLSDTKMVASLHVRVSLDIKGELSEEYMELARQIRRCLHGYGIHSSTIQPEFWCQDAAKKRGKATDLPPEPSTEDDSCSQEDTSSETHRKSGFADSSGCLLDCDDECGDGGKCCVPAGYPEVGTD